MNISVEIGMLLVQLVGVVYFFGALNQRVKSLEALHATKDDTGVRLGAIEAKLDLLVPELERIRNRLDTFLDNHAATRFRRDGGDANVPE
jgi:hypothetical protein